MKLRRYQFAGFTAGDLTWRSWRWQCYAWFGAAGYGR